MKKNEVIGMENEEMAAVAVDESVESGAVISEEENVVLESTDEEIIDELEDELDEVDEDEDDDEPEICFNLLREKFTVKKDGKKISYWRYFVEEEGYVGKVKVSFDAADKGGYEVLSLLFELPGTPRVTHVVQTMVDSATKKKTAFDIYTAFNDAPDGSGRFEYQVKPSEKSDKALFDMIERCARARLKNT